MINASVNPSNNSTSAAVTSSATSKTRPNILRKQPRTSRTPLELIDPSSSSNIRRKSLEKGIPQSGVQSGADVEYIGTSPAGKNTTAREPAIGIATLVASQTTAPGGKSTSPSSAQTDPMSGQNSASTSQASSRNIAIVTASSSTHTTARPTLATLVAMSETERNSSLIGSIREYMDNTVTNLVRGSASCPNQKANTAAKSASVAQTGTENLPNHANRRTEKLGDHANLSKSGGATKKADDSFLAWQQEIHGVVRDIVHNNPVSTTTQQPVVCMSATTATISSMSHSGNNMEPNVVVSAALQQPVVSNPSVVRNVTQTTTTSPVSHRGNPVASVATPGPGGAEQGKRGSPAVIYNPILR